MKSFAARLSVVVLAATGFAASTVISTAAVKKNDFKQQISVTVPTPMCGIYTNPNPCRDSMGGD